MLVLTQSVSNAINTLGEKIESKVSDIVLVIELKASFGPFSITNNTNIPYFNESIDTLNSLKSNVKS